jgi:hypothetical protein
MTRPLPSIQPEHCAPRPFAPWTWGVTFGTEPHPLLELYSHGRLMLTLPLSRAEAEQLLPEIGPCPSLPETSGRTA